MTAVGGIFSSCLGYDLHTLLIKIKNLELIFDQCL